VKIGDGVNATICNTIAVSGNDVYVAGSQLVRNGTHDYAKYWKNGIGVDISTDLKLSQCNSIAISGNDVYVAGEEFNGTNMVAKYWKNGVAVNLSDQSKIAEASSIFVATH
jgi:hypothetical protein